MIETENSFYICNFFKGEELYFVFYHRENGEMAQSATEFSENSLC
jgi:hypothetical protein